MHVKRFACAHVRTLDHSGYCQSLHFQNNSLYRFFLKGHRLRVVNMNQQSDTADLLGG